VNANCAEGVRTARISKHRGKPASNPAEELVSGGWIRDGAIAQVTAEERTALSAVLTKSESFSVGSWVRIQRSRLYKGDIGIVMAHPPATYAVAVLPCLHMYTGKKRKGAATPPAAQMNVAIMRGLYGEDSVKDLDHGFYRFGGHIC